MHATITQPIAIGLIANTTKKTTVDRAQLIYRGTPHRKADRHTPSAGLTTIYRGVRHCIKPWLRVVTPGQRIYRGVKYSVG